MKKLFLLIFIAAAFFACKRKKNLAEPNGTLAEYPVTCYNSTLDGDETGTDCGGSCAPCNFVTPTCTYTANILKIGASNYSTTATSCSVSGQGESVWGGWHANGSYDIRTGSNPPDMSKSYSIVSSFPNGSQATAYITDGSLGGLTLSAGTVYITKSGGKFHATICGGVAYSFVTSNTVTISGDVSCP